MQPAATSDIDLENPAAAPDLWALDPAVVFLNHGSFGSCPRAVLEFQQELRARLERQPIQFFVRDLEGLWDQARETLARFLKADPDGLVFVPNATTGVNTVLRSLRLQPADELLVTQHEYNACRNALNVAAEACAAHVVVANVPFPLQSDEQIVEAVLAKVTSRTRLALLDHVTSQTALIFPLARLVRELAARGVETLIDGAHAPGMVPVELDALGATYYTGNCHKWLCAPKGAAFLYVQAPHRARVRPLVISHGANSPRRDRSRLLIEFGWMGTGDPTAWLSVPAALEWMERQRPGGWPAILQRNRALALAARQLLAEALQVELPAPDTSIGALASLTLPDSRSAEPSKSPLYLDRWQEQLLATHSIEVPVIPWPAPPKRLLRISAQLYNSLPQYRRLAEALRAGPP
jgi:isopenicillin-N epimerase